MFTNRPEWFLLGAIVLGCLSASPPASRGAEMTAGLERDTIYSGTSTLLVVEVSNARSADWPVVEPVEGLRITPYGSPGVIRDLFRGTIRRSYRFMVAPEKAGVFRISSVSLTADGEFLKRGPFTLRVVELPLKFHAVEIEPGEILVGETAKLTVSYQGVRPGKVPVVPEVPGLSIRLTGSPRVQVTRREGIPISSYEFNVRAARLGDYQIKGLSLDGVPADAVALIVSSFVVVRTQVGASSLVVGGQTIVHIVVRGLPESAGLEPVAPAGLRVVPARQAYRGPPGTTVFSFDVTATEPGTPTITALQLPEGRQIALAQPISLSVRQSGEGGILACRGKPRTDQTVIGEPFVVDYEVFFRGDLRAAGIDPAGADFANKPYIKVQPVNDLTYPGFSGQPIQVRFGQGRAVMLSGSGEFNGQKEQLLRFALRITPLAAGELSLDGLRVLLLLQIKEEQRTAFSVTTSSRSEQYERLAEVPPHRVIDPPGKTAPSGYRGAVGTSFTFATKLDRTKATAMSPLTLTMKITGESVGPQFAPLPLTEVPELTRDFDVSPTVGGGEVTDSTITFTQVVRPRSEAVTELPALPLVYYDYERKVYDTVYSLPIPIDVTPGSLVGAGAMEVTSLEDAHAGDAAAGHEAPTTPAVSLGANHTTLGDVATGKPIGPVGILAILIAGPVSIVLVRAGRQVYQRQRPVAEVRQRRRKLIADLDRVAGADHFHAALAETLQSYLRLTFDLPPGELSTNLLARAFQEHSASDDLRREAQELLAQCDAGRFAAGAVDDAEKARLIHRTRELLARLDRGVK